MNTVSAVADSEHCSVASMPLIVIKTDSATKNMLSLPLRGKRKHKDPVNNHVETVLQERRTHQGPATRNYGLVDKATIDEEVKQCWKGIILAKCMRCTKSKPPITSSVDIARLDRTTKITAVTQLATRFRPALQITFQNSAMVRCRADQLQAKYAGISKDCQSLCRDRCSPIEADESH